MNAFAHRTEETRPDTQEELLVSTRLYRAKVVLADDHPLFRDGLSRAISSHLGLELVGEASDGPEALALIEEFDPDVALLDIKMPGLDGIEVCASVARRVSRPATRIVLLSAYLEPSLVWRAAVAGAAGYLSKEASRNDICDALVDVALGGTAFGPEAENGLIGALEQIHAIEAPDTTGM